LSVVGLGLVLLVHGGLWGDEDSGFFWERPGVISGLSEHVEVLAPDRPARAASWGDEAEHLARSLVRPAVVVGGSYGCSAAVRLAVSRPELVERLVLAWPATAGDPDVDRFVRDALGRLGAAPDVIDGLLRGETLPGVTDAELRGLRMPVAVVATVPENPVHQRRTVDAIKRLAGAVELGGCPEPPRDGFQAGGFVNDVVQFGLMR
jgi:pimeloyl-ACP methyl ester carboxylesterase